MATAALALSIEPSLTSASFTDLLISTSEDLGRQGRDNSYGYGLVNPALLLATLTGDSEHFILSAWNDTVGVSAFINFKDSITFVSLYDDTGRMIGIIGRNMLSNCTISTKFKQLLLLTVHCDDFVILDAKDYR